MYCTVLRCNLVCSIVLYCTLLYSIVLYCTILYCTVLYCTVLYYTVLYCTLLTVLYLNIVLNWPEDGRLRPKHVAKYNLILIIASCLGVGCVLTNTNTNLIIQNGMASVSQKNLRLRPACRNMLRMSLGCKNVKPWQQKQHIFWNLIIAYQNGWQARTPRRNAVLPPHKTSNFL